MKYSSSFKTICFKVYAQHNHHGIYSVYHTTRLYSDNVATNSQNQQENYIDTTILDLDKIHYDHSYCSFAEIIYKINFANQILKIIQTTQKTLRSFTTQ